jgi:hypothetical protein
MATKQACGIARICSLSDDRLLAAREFLTLSRATVLRPAWGTAIWAAEAEPDAVWIRLPRVPVLPPYRAPGTWGELRRAVAEGPGSGLDALLCAALNRIRDGNEHIALIGFPIPETFSPSAVPAVMHWQAMRLPPLAYGSNYRPGFRASARGYWMQDRYGHFRDSDGIRWLESCNWHEDQLAGRGRFNTKLSGLRTAIIGAGAVGSVLAELLVRGGANHLLVVDPKSVQGGNLVRHTLGVAAIGGSKAEALAEKLNDASLHASVIGIRGTFPDGLPKEAVDQLRSCELVIECSANDGVLRATGEWGWSETARLASLSLGFEAERLYVVAGPANGQHLAALIKAFRPELDRDRECLEKAKLSGEAVGCWHPLFPARVDRIWAMVATAISHVEGWVACEQPGIVAILLRWHDGQVLMERREIA